MVDESALQLMSVPAAAKRLGVSPRTVWRLVRDKDLDSITVGRRRLIPATSVAAFIAARLPDSPAA